MTAIPYGLHLGDCLAWLESLEPESVDAIVTDPPYGLGFMGKAWDALPPGLPWAEACYRALKPGGHLLAFGATRTVHRLACAVEDAGFELRDQVHWLYFNGFPKNLDVSKALDARRGLVRPVVGSKAGQPGYSLAPSQGATVYGGGIGGRGDPIRELEVTAPVSPETLAWSGWGTALKPAIEPAVLARKPLEGSVAANLLVHGTGALNVDACRYRPRDPAWPGPQDRDDTVRPGNQFRGILYGEGREGFGGGHPGGRWPANVYHCPKASRSERERGCEGLPVFTGAEAVARAEGSAGLANPRAGAGRTARAIRNPHPTVKPVRLMRWLVRLLCRPGGLVVDPFLGSGSTGIAALLEGLRFAGAEREEAYLPIAEARIAHALAHPGAWRATRPGGPSVVPRPPKPVPVAQLTLAWSR